MLIKAINRTSFSSNRKRSKYLVTFSTGGNGRQLTLLEEAPINTLESTLASPFKVINTHSLVQQFHFLGTYRY